MNQNPFSFYDFLGYLIPGGVFTCVITFMFLPDLWGVIGELSLALNGSIFAGSSILVSFIIVFYIVGHLVSLLSSSFVEKYLTETYGWPSQYLFIETKTDSSKSAKSYYLDLKNKVVTGETKWVCASQCVLRKIIIAIILTPLIAVERLFMYRVLGIRPNQLPEPLNSRLLIQLELFFDKSKIDLPYEIGSKRAIEGDLFRFIYHYAQENSDNHVPKMANYVALYGFSRNICFVFVMLFWASLFQTEIENRDYSLSFIFLIASSIFFYGFEKFYHRFTLEAMMACVSIRDNES
ncbi:hypothetical protein ACPD1E_003527 [Vibrio cholerae]